VAGINSTSIPTCHPKEISMTPNDDLTNVIEADEEAAVYHCPRCSAECPEDLLFPTAHGPSPICIGCDHAEHGGAGCDLADAASAEKAP
jgi:hypothetical protein